MYECHKLAGAGYYFKSWSEDVRLISCLPKSNKGMKDDYLIASGEWNNGLHCPTWAGDPSVVPLGSVPLEGDLAFLALLFLLDTSFSFGERYFFWRSNHDFLLGCFCK